jgi:hypothetical protein
MTVTPPIPLNEPADNLYKMMAGDFEDAWNAIAAREDLQGRGNFMFARQALGLLEFASRLCSADPTGAALTDFTAALRRIEPRYFTSLPGACARPGFRNGQYEWMLPSSSAQPERELLWAMFDMVRHGQAHQAQQIVVELQGGDTFGISLTGASYGRTLDSVASAPRPAAHLSAGVGADGGLRLVVLPEMLFLDFNQAVNDARLFNRGLNFPYLRRQATPGGNYDFNVQAARAALTAAGHPTFQRQPGPARRFSRLRRFLASLCRRIS